MLPVVGLLVPIGATVALWHRFAVDVPFEDEWSFVTLLRATDRGRLTLAALWAQHNENRMVVPRLVALALAGPTREDSRALMLVGVALLAAAGLGMAALTVRMGLRSWWWAVPAGVALLSWVQVDNLLWGFQFAWYLILAALIVVIAVLARRPLGARALALAAAAAVIASASSLSGLFLWPAGLLVLVGPGARARQRGAWIALGATTTALYLVGYRPVAGAATGAARGAPSIATDPLAALRYLLEAVGAVVRWPTAGVSALRPPVPPPPLATEVLGALILVLAALVLVAGWRRRRLSPAVLVPAALFAFALQFDLALTIGRLGLGVDQAAASRYTTYDLLWPIGIWLGVAAIWTAQPRTGRRPRAGWPRRTRAAAPIAAGIALAALAGLSVPFGWQAAEATAGRRLEAAEIVLAYPAVPRPLVRTFLYPAPLRLRADIAFLARRRLGPFAAPLATRARDWGVVPGGRPGRLLPVPPRLGALVRQGTAGGRAWSVLSSVYDRAPWIRRAFPAAGRSGPPGPAGLLAWAVGPGQVRVELGPYLRPVRAALAQLGRLAAIGRAGPWPPQLRPLTPGLAAR